MTESDINKINRFSERCPDHLAEHWNEIIDIINAREGNDAELSQLEMDVAKLVTAHRDTVTDIYILQDGVESGNIKSRKMFNLWLTSITDNIKLVCLAKM